jgi:hypothetical protein
VSAFTGLPDASCTVGSAVVVNDERWRDGALGDLIDLPTFRVHELNHETGHFLGQGHFSCQGGVAAVNQQQFRSLVGCTANAWPLPWERAMVALRFGLWPAAGVYEPYDVLEPVEVTSQGSAEPGGEPPPTDPSDAVAEATPEPERSGEEESREGGSAEEGPREEGSADGPSGEPAPGEEPSEGSPPAGEGGG